MKNVMLVCFVLMLFSGCTSVEKKNIPANKPISSFLLAEPNEWKAQYGSDEHSQLYLNLAVQQQIVNNQGKAIKILQDTVKLLVKDVNEVKIKK